MDKSRFAQSQFQASKLFTRTLITLLCIIGLTSIGAADFAGGDGSEDDPYQIESTDHFNNINKELLEEDEPITENFVLTNDIDFDGEEIKPIGHNLTDTYSYEYFEGTFDGNAHTIKNANIESPHGYISIVARNGGNGTIKDLTVKNSDFTSDGGNYVGAIAGNNAGTIKNVRVLDSEIATTHQLVGGVTGRNSGDIENVFISGSNITASTSYAGVIVGRDQGSIQGVAVQNADLIDSSGDLEQAGLITGMSDSESVYNEIYFAEMNQVDYEDLGCGDPFLGHDSSFGVCEFEEPEEASSIYWDKETVNIDENSVDGNFSNSLSTSEMTGESAGENMAFDWENTWLSISGDYPMQEVFPLLPTASFVFEGDPATNVVGENVAFNDNSNPVSDEIVDWEWDFGDGTTSTEENPTNVFEDAGDYGVSLTVENDDGGTDTVAQEVSVNSIPKAGFMYEPLDPDPEDEIQFFDESTDEYSSIESVEWDFGDGTASTESNPVKTDFEPDNEYDVTFTVTDEHGVTNSTAFTIKIPDEPMSWNEYQHLYGEDEQEELQDKQEQQQQESRPVNQITGIFGSAIHSLFSIFPF